MAVAETGGVGGMKKRNCRTTLGHVHTGPPTIISTMGMRSIVDLKGKSARVRPRLVNLLYDM